MYALGFLLTVFLSSRRLDVTPTESQETLFWILALIVVMITGPLTWVMNTIWIIALVPFCFFWLFSEIEKPLRYSRTLIILGMVVVSLPDHHVFSTLIPPTVFNPLLQSKYIIALLLIFTGLVMDAASGITSTKSEPFC